MSSEKIWPIPSLTSATWRLSGVRRVPGLQRHLSHRNHPVRARDLPGRGLERERRHFHQQRTAGQPGAQGRRTRRADAKPNWWVFKEIARRMGQEWESEQRARRSGTTKSRVLAPQHGGHQVPPHRRGRPAVAGARPGPSRHAVPAQGRLFHLRTGQVHPRGMDAARRKSGRGVSPGAEHRPPALSLSHPDPDRHAAKGSTIFCPRRPPTSSPADAEKLESTNGEKIRVKSRRGADRSDGAG